MNIFYQNKAWICLYVTFTCIPEINGILLIRGPYYLWNQCLSPLSCEFESRYWRGVVDTTLCDKVGQWHAAGLWFSLGIPVSSTNTTDSHHITEILLKVTLNTITLTLKVFYVLQVISYSFWYFSWWLLF